MDVGITHAELALMRLIWRNSPLNARQITDKLAPEKDWHRKTVNTLLGRLKKKGALATHKQDDGINYYTPLVEEEAYHQATTSIFVDQVFGGLIAPLVACFAKTRPLTTEQVAELRQLLEELSDYDS